MIKAVIPLTLLVFGLAGCGEVNKWYFCGFGHKDAQDGNYADAIASLNKCLKLQNLTAEQQAFYLQTRAWSHFSLHDAVKALRDQEYAFRLVEPTTHREFINHAAYLRMAGKALESLEPLLKAEVIDSDRGQVSMMTQYNRGWSLYDLGRYDEAIAAFDLGITVQPEYPFVYFKRGLAYDRLGRVDEARDDFDRFTSYFEDEGVEFNPRFEQELKTAAEKYAELRILLNQTNEE